MVTPRDIALRDLLRRKMESRHAAPAEPAEQPTEPPPAWKLRCTWWKRQDARAADFARAWRRKTLG
jgi:hypothetical protein